MRTYKAYDINGYRFYTEERDRSSKYQNSRVTMLSYANDEATIKERLFGRIVEIWELDYTGEKVPMSVSDGPRASRKRAGISPPWLYPMPPRRTPPRKMSHGYSRAKLTNASSSPARQSQAVLS
jgi:hypothetical protein